MSRLVHSASTEPPEEPFCEKCQEWEFECGCEVGYQEERDEY